jgi:hypothetical protein
MRFDFFQVSVVDGGGNLYMQELTHERRNEIAKDIVLGRPTGIYRSQSYHLGNLAEQNGAIWGRIIRPGATQIGIVDEQTGDVDDAEIDSAFWTHFAYLIEEQVFAVVRNQDFFSGESSGMARLLERVLNAGLSQENYSIRVIPKSRPQQFWEIVNAAKVTYLRFEFVPPNAFRSQGPLTDLLRTLRTNNGAKKVGYDLRNAQNGLEIQQSDEAINEEVSYIARGGGKWKVNYQDGDGVTKTARSDQAAVDGQIDYRIDQITNRDIRAAIFAWIRGILERLL